ncbi:hypothetical protein [Actinacidiphila sp. ITFR-21]|uniref:hypothetical protein n=1 Tax=Actinacidiphila sp. ITFR-21 TaxID=3075199 RepID=UPI00288A7450|nr:hypothetical protein [Streptomyces sp. ITFR-21]WNI17564.1 hypothetical protein RLT57_19940 [Streptomyces sp. ITFR-21]WNI17704.1 hypothetical protein RLT57_20655 [Streptomyces sp. ITFR-21]
MSAKHTTTAHRRDTDLVRFHLDRAEDVTGISGTGTVAGGVIFPDGTVAMRWNTHIASTAVYDSINDVVEIHGHNGATVVTLIDTREAGAA